MIDIGFTLADAIRAAWVFVAGFAVAMAQNGGQTNKAALWAAGAAGLLALKNLVLSDDSRLKG